MIVLMHSHSAVLFVIAMLVYCVLQCANSYVVSITYIGAADAFLHFCGLCALAL
jgi:hypothetical protein